MSNTTLVDRIKADIISVLEGDVDGLVAKLSNILNYYKRSCKTFMSSCYDKNRDEKCDFVNLPHKLILPDNTRFFARTQKDVQIVIEHPPQVRHCFFAQDLIYNYWYFRENRNNRPFPLQKSFPLALPWLVFISYEREGNFYLQVCARKSRLTSLDDILYCCPLPNVGNHLHGLCFGKEGLHEVMAIKDLHQKVKKAIDIFYNYYFNIDIVKTFEKFLDRNSFSLREWVSKTAENPQFILDTKFIQSDCGTLRECMKSNFSKIGMEVADYHENLLIDILNRVTQNISDYRLSDVVDLPSSIRDKVLKIIEKE